MRALLTKCRNWLARDIVAAIDRQSAILMMQALPDKTISFPFQGKTVRMFLPDGDSDTIQSYIALNRTFYEEHVLLQIQKRFDLSGGHVADIGANIGNHTVFLTLFCDVAKCHSFEPNPYAAAILRRNTELSSGNVEIHDTALSDASERLGFAYAPARNLGGMAFEQKSTGGFSSVTLDSLGLPQLDFIKIDVEGMANKVLLGGADTFASYRPPVLIELLEQENSDCRSTLARYGYRQTADVGGGMFFFERS